MHPSAYAFASTALAAGDVTGRRVVETGAFNYNGTVRPVYEAMRPASYTATDMQPGPSVDVQCRAEELPAVLGEQCADVIISTEMLEHAADWRAAMTGMTRALAPGGKLLLTTRGPGFPYHPHPEDHWRFTTGKMDSILAALGLHVIRLEPDIPPDYGVLVLAVKPDGWDGADETALAAIEAWPALRSGGFIAAASQ